MKSLDISWCQVRRFAPPESTYGRISESKKYRGVWDLRAKSKPPQRSIDRRKKYKPAYRPNEISCVDKSTPRLKANRYPGSQPPGLRLCRAYGSETYLSSLRDERESLDNR